MDSRDVRADLLIFALVLVLLLAVPYTLSGEVHSLTAPSSPETPMNRTIYFPPTTPADAAAINTLFTFVELVLGAVVYGFVLIQLLPGDSPRCSRAPAARGESPSPTARHRSPASAPPAPTAAPSTEPPVDGVPRCGRPTSFVAQYGRNYCSSCQQYV